MNPKSGYSIYLIRTSTTTSPSTNCRQMFQGRCVKCGQVGECKLDSTTCLHRIAACCMLQYKMRLRLKTFFMILYFFKFYFLHIFYYFCFRIFSFLYTIKTKETLVLAPNVLFRKLTRKMNDDSARLEKKKLVSPKTSVAYNLIEDVKKEWEVLVESHVYYGKCWEKQSNILSITYKHTYYAIIQLRSQNLFWLRMCALV